MWLVQPRDYRDAPDGHGGFVSQRWWFARRWHQRRASHGLMAGHCPYSSLRMSCEYPAEKISVERRRMVGLATDTARRRSACREVAGLALADTARRQQLVHCQSPISSRINDYKCCGYRFIATLIHNRARITITSSVSINFLNRRAESTLGIRTKLSRWVETEALVLVRERDRS